MKKILVAIMAFVVLFVCAACEFGSGSSDTIDVKGYYRSNGTYVEPHTRTKGNK